MTQRYEAIFLDADETIVDFNKCQRCAFTSVASETLPEVDVEDLYTHYAAANVKAWERYNSGELTKVALRSVRMAETFQGHSVDIPRFVHRYEEQLAVEVHFMPDAVETLELLANYCLLVVVTNGLGHVHRSRFEKAGISHLFAGVVVSGDYNDALYRKPNHEIFKDAHRRFAPMVDKSRVLIIGDSEESDIIGGVNYGIDTCLFAPVKAQKLPSSSANYCIQHWCELPNIVGVS